MPAGPSQSAAPLVLSLDTATCTPGGDPAAPARLLVLANLHGHVSRLVELAREHKADAVLCVGDFGCYDASSVSAIDDRTLRYWLTYSPLVAAYSHGPTRAKLTNPTTPMTLVRSTLAQNPSGLLSEFGKLLDGSLTLDVPVFVVPGVCEDVYVLERLRARQSSIPNFTIIDEATTRLLHVGGVKLRLYGIGGIWNAPKLFDHGDGKATIAGKEGKTWMTALQIGELVELAQSVHKNVKDASEVRMLCVYSSPNLSPFLSQLATVLQADYTVCAELHSKYTTAYSEASIHPSYDAYCAKISLAHENVMAVWDAVKDKVEGHVSEVQNIFLQNFLAVANRLPQPSKDGKEPSDSWKNIWHWGLSDVSSGALVLKCRDGAIGSEAHTEGISFANRGQAEVKSIPISAASPAVSSNKKGQAKQDESDRTGEVTGNKTSGSSKFSDSKQASSSHSSAMQGTPSNQIHSDAISSSSQYNKENEDTAVTGSPSDVMSGNHTPRMAPKPRNPWTLYIKWSGDARISEDDLKGLLGPDLAAKATYFKIVLDHKTQQQKPFAYIEFAEESSMRQGIELNGTVLKDTPLHISQANPPNHAPRTNSFRLRGGPGGAFSKGGRGGSMANVNRSNSGMEASVAAK